VRKLRRKDRSIENEEAIQLLCTCEYGFLSTVSENGQPYGIPLHYVYKDGSIYFHCAKVGQKIENIENDNRVSFSVVGKTEVLPDKFSAEYESVIVFGSASETEGIERENALLWLLEKYSPEYLEEGKNYIKKKGKATKVIKIAIEHFTGKARR
jgi:hypothetical protein